MRTLSPRGKKLVFRDSPVLSWGMLCAVFCLETVHAMPRPWGVCCECRALGRARYSTPSQKAPYLSRIVVLAPPLPSPPTPPAPPAPSLASPYPPFSLSCALPVVSLRFFFWFVDRHQHALRRSRGASAAVVRLCVRGQVLPYLAARSSLLRISVLAPDARVPVRRCGPPVCASALPCPWPCRFTRPGPGTRCGDPCMSISTSGPASRSTSMWSSMLSCAAEAERKGLGTRSARCDVGLE